MATIFDGSETHVAPLKVFYSYSRDDAELRRHLAEQLTPLRDERLITDWHDDSVVPGSDFDAIIRAKLAESDLILLLVSPAFLASEYIREHELPLALDLEKQGRAVVLPVLLRPIENWRSHSLFAHRQSPISGDTAVTERRNRDTAFAKIAEGVRRTAMAWREKRAASPAGGGVAEVRVEFLYAPIDSKLFQKIDENPYKSHYSPAEDDERSRAKAFLWLPPRSALRGDLLEYTTVAVVCDAGRPELEKHGPEFEADLKRVEAYFPLSPSALKPEQREDFARIAGKLLSGTYIVAAAVPRLLLGYRVDDPDLVYDVLLNLLVLPLAAGHARLRFQRFDLRLNRIDEANSRKKPLERQSKKLLKAKFGEGQYSVEQLSTADPDYFYLYTARFVQWAAHRCYNEKADDWMLKLRKAFE